MAKGIFNRVFSAATVAFTLKTSLYKTLYSKHMGTEQAPPVLAQEDYPWPDKSELDFEGVDSPFSTGTITIGTFPRSPYYHYPKGATEPVGFEIDFCAEILKLINQQYETNLKVYWHEVEIPEGELAYDGTEPTVISAYMEGGMGKDYDMVMSGGLTKVDTGDEADMPPVNTEDGAPPQPSYEYCAPYADFHVGACYCGKKDLKGLPASSVSETYKVLAAFAKDHLEINGETMLVTHTSSLSDPNKGDSQQSQAAQKLIVGINVNGGTAKSQPRLVPGLLDGIRFSTVQAYVGDGFQIQVMNADEGNYAHVKDLGMKFYELVVAAYTKNGW